jgi:transposase
MMRHGTAHVQTSRQRCKLDEEKVAQILALKGVKSQRQIAAMFDISNRTVSKIHLGKAWKDGKKQKPGFQPGDPRNKGNPNVKLPKGPRLTRDYVP